MTTDTTTKMATKVMKHVHCKACGKNFDRLAWLTNKECDMPESCHCPEVKKAMQKTRQVIDKAKQQAGYVTTVKKISIPTQRNEDLDQYFIPMEPLVVIEVSKKK